MHNNCLDFACLIEGSTTWNCAKYTNVLLRPVESCSALNLRVRLGYPAYTWSRENTHQAPLADTCACHTRGHSACVLEAHLRKQARQLLPCHSNLKLLQLGLQLSRIYQNSHLPPRKCCHRCSRRSSQTPYNSSRKLVLTVRGTRYGGLAFAMRSARSIGSFDATSMITASVNDWTLPRSSSQKATASEKRSSLTTGGFFLKAIGQGSAANLRHSHTLSNATLDAGEVGVLPTSPLCR